MKQKNKKKSVCASARFKLGPADQVFEIIAGRGDELAELVALDRDDRVMVVATTTKEAAALRAYFAKACEDESKLEQK